MTASNRLRPAVLALACLAWMAPAQAQDTAPADPAPANAATNAATSTSGSAPVSLLPEPDPDAPPQPVDTSIAVGELRAPGIDRLGLVSSARGGFDPNLWQGTEPAFLKQILPLFPVRIFSAAERRLAENLLLSPGAPPVAEAGENTEQPPETFDPAALLLARVQSLAAMGNSRDAVALIELVPADQMTDALRRIHADAELALGGLEPACADARAALQATANVYWQELQVFCQVVEGQASAAALGLDVLREQRLDDPAFFWAADVLQGARKPPPASVAAVSPLVVAMLRKAEAPLPDALAKVTDPTAMGMVAAMVTVDQDAGGAPLKPGDTAKRERQRRAVEARILLAERAVAAGSLDPEVLRDLYKTIDLKQDTDLPLLTKVAPDDLRGRALLYQSALAQTVPTARAEVITRAVELARLDGGDKGPDLSVVGKVYGAMLAEMEASGEMVWFAGTAARALLAAGDTAKAKVWLDLVHGMARNSLEANGVADSLFPVERLLSPAKGRMPTSAVRAWAATAPEVVLAAQKQTLLNLFIAVGEDVAPGDFAQALADKADDDAPKVNPAVWNGLTLAARAKRVGEVAALSVIALSEDGPAKAAPATLQKVIESLMAVGRDADARALAVETALIHGL